jgi:hypothetical protein
MILLPLLVGAAGDPVRPACHNLRRIDGWRRVPVRVTCAEGAKVQQQARHEDSRCGDIQEKWPIGGAVAAWALSRITTWHRRHNARAPAGLQPPLAIQSFSPMGTFVIIGRHARRIGSPALRGG